MICFGGPPPGKTPLLIAYRVVGAVRVKADAIFEGGGVKGIALVGALAAAEERGYQWVNVAGTSAGAIVAALVAAGYRAEEIRAVMLRLDLRQFRMRRGFGRVPALGPFLQFLFRKGLYAPDPLEAWLDEMLARKGVRTFGDLILDEYRDDERYRFRLCVIASDISRAAMLVLPRDIRAYGYRPEDLRVARAVRMSASIPIYYEPSLLRNRTGRGRPRDSYIVDGGLLSNYPVWLFDVPGVPEWPTFGFKLVSPAEARPRTIIGPLTLLEAVLNTLLAREEVLYAHERHTARTIAIPTLGVRTTEFDLPPERRLALYRAGYEAAQTFFQQWDFERYVRRYRA